MVQSSFGANHFVFIGERTTIFYQPNGEAPLSTNSELYRPSLEYQGPQGSQNFVGKDISLQNSLLGNMITVIFTTRDTRSTISLTLIIPAITPTADQTMTFETILLQTSSRDLAEGPTILPLLGMANNVFLPLAMLAKSN